MAALRRPPPPPPDSQIPENQSTRPCRCPVCREVPALPTSSLTQGNIADDSAPPGDSSEFLGVYPRGFHQVAIAELERRGMCLIAHHQEHCAVIFSLPHPQQRGSDQAVDVVELGAFSFVFELVGALVELPPAPDLAQLAAAAEAQVRAAPGPWRSALRRFRWWRASVHRSGATLRFKSPDVAPVIGESLALAGAVALSPECTAGPQVDLAHFDVEVAVYISDGVDELMVAAGEQRTALAGLRPELLALGVLSRATRCRAASLRVEKGSVLSSADSTVALCVAQRALEKLLTEVPTVPGEKPRVLALDPMCGVGTYLFALRWVCDNWSPTVVSSTPPIFLDLLGIDSEATSVERASAHGSALKSSTGTRPSWMLGSSLHLPLRSGTTDLIIVDPPWGQRHASHTTVKRYFLKWAKEWVRVLRPGGMALVVTICTKLFEGGVFEPLAKAGLLMMEESFQFDNKGYRQCKLYIVRRQQGVSLIAEHVSLQRCSEQPMVEDRSRKQGK